MYATVVSTARQPEYFTIGKVPDSLDGRFDMLALHLTLVLRRLRGQGMAAATLAQGLFDRFAADMDRSLREMGVGDMGIRRRVVRMGEALYGRMAAYDHALRQPTDQRLAAVMTALDANLYGTVPTDSAALAWMAEHMMAHSDALDRCPLDVILTGTTAAVTHKTAPSYEDDKDAY